jgi:hypothetical protein
MVEILRRSMAQGIWMYKSFAFFLSFLFFYFLGHWKFITSQACIMSVMLHIY